MCSDHVACENLWAVQEAGHNEDYSAVVVDTDRCRKGVVEAAGVLLLLLHREEEAAMEGHSVWYRVHDSKGARSMVLEAAVVVHS